MFYKENLFKSIIETFQKIPLDQSIKNTRNERIIFICGMPRSGTTLTEQILASHKDVEGAGELIYLQQAIRSNFFKDEIVIKETISGKLFIHFMGFLVCNA